MSFTIACPTTTPTGTATIEIFNSVTAFGATQLRHLPIKRISFAAEHDQTFTARISRSTNGGTNWDVVNSQSVPVVANTIGGPIDYLIDTYEDVKIEVVNGGVDQTTWRPELHGHEDTRQPGT
jgi:hypothetical protein